MTTTRNHDPVETTTVAWTAPPPDGVQNLTPAQEIETIFRMLGADSEDSAPKAQPQENPGRAQPDSPPWVLCVDDDAAYSNALKLRLESHGVAVIRAFDGMEGFRLVFTRPADVILLDYHVPNGRGDYILTRLKQSAVTRGIPVIVITGNTDLFLERRMRDLGAANLFHKPIAFDKLREELVRHIPILALPPRQLNSL